MVPGSAVLGTSSPRISPVVRLTAGSAAGAGLKDHLHLHVVPRWEGDTNFMPVLGDVRVVSEALSSTWKRLKEAWTN